MISSMSGRPAGSRSTARLRPPTTGRCTSTAEVRAVGHDFDGYYGWHYPPPRFSFAAALATLPYLVAAVIWLATTLAAYVAAIAGILGLRTGILVRARISCRDLERHRRTERLPHRGADRRHARIAGAASGAGRYLSRASHLQAAIRFAVSDRADRRPALADHCGRHTRRRSRSRRCRGSPSAAQAGRPSRIGCRSRAASLLGEGAPDLVPAAKRVRAWCAPMAAAKRWPGPFKACCRCRSPSDLFGCGGAASPSISRPRRSPPARCSRRLISLCTTWSCSPSRWRSCCGSP